MKRRILVFISSDLYIRNYITTKAFREIEKRYELRIVIGESVVGLDDLKGVDYRVLHQHSGNRRIHFKIFDLLMWRYRKRSKTFVFRYNRFYGLDFRFRQRLKFPEMVREIFSRIARSSRYRVKNALRANALVFPLYFAQLKNRLKLNPDIEKIFDEFSPELVLLPSSAHDPEVNDVLLSCRKHKILSLMLVDNWDNLSSKSILWEKPDHIAVWGEQSVEHACDIQGFNREQVTSIGTPRYDEYFEYREERLPSPFDFPYVLFVGTALEFDEADAIRRLDEIITRNYAVFNGVKIVYRPHPWRQGTDTIIGMELKHVVIDPQMEKAYRKNEHSDAFQPALDYYPKLLGNSEFVIGGLTSMLIEALIFRKRFLGLVYDDGINVTNQLSVYRNYTHFEGIDTIEALTLCFRQEELEALFVAVWNKRKEIDSVQLDEKRQYYYYHEGRKYPERLFDLCDSILSAPVSARD